MCLFEKNNPIIVEKNKCFLTLLFFIILLGYSSHGQTSWTKQNSGTMINLNSIVWAGNQFVIGGDHGIILTSPDAKIWSKQNSGIDTGWGNGVASITSTGTIIVAVGGFGIISSTNGILWEKQVNPISPNGLGSVIWANNKLLAAGSIIIYSNNGINWFASNIQPEWSLQCDIVWTDSFFITIGGNEYQSSCSKSKDGISWENRISCPTMNSMVWTGDRIIGTESGGYVYSSTDGINWTKIGPTGSQVKRWACEGRLFWNGNLFLYCGWSIGGIYSSPDGKTWTKHESVSNQILNCIISDGKQFLVVGDSGTILTSPINGVSIQKKQTIVLSRELMVRVFQSKISAIVPNLPFDQKVFIEIYSISGKKIFSKTFVNTQKRIELQTGHLGTGTYTLIAKFNGRKLSKSFYIIR